MKEIKVHHYLNSPSPNIRKKDSVLMDFTSFDSKSRIFEPKKKKPSSLRQQLEEKCLESLSSCIRERKRVKSNREKERAAKVRAEISFLFREDSFHLFFFNGRQRVKLNGEKDKSATMMMLAIDFLAAFT